MRKRTVVFHTAAFALVAGCHQAQPAITATHRAALADSIEQMVAHVLAGFEHPDLNAILSYYERGNGLAFAENGMIYPTFDSLAAAARYMGVGVTVRASLAERNTIVLDRDVVVMTAMIHGTTTGAAGVMTNPVLAWTLVFHRTSDGWKIAASHESFPPQCPGSPPQRPGPKN